MVGCEPDVGFSVAMTRLPRRMYSLVSVCAWVVDRVSHRHNIDIAILDSHFMNPLYANIELLFTCRGPPKARFRVVDSTFPTAVDAPFG